MTFLELYGAQLNIELSNDDTTQLFTLARRKKAVNDAQLAFARQTGCTRRYGSITMTDGTGEYSVIATLTDWIRLAAAPSVKIVDGSVTTWIQGFRDFPRRDPEWLDHEDPGWRAAPAGTPASWYEQTNSGVTYLGVTPAPDIDGETWTLYVPYVASPSTMTADADVPFKTGSVSRPGLDVYHQGLVHYAAAQLEPLRKNFAGAQEQMSKYASYAADYLVKERETGPDQVTYVREYLGESHHGMVSYDPRRWP